tara:strand:- start:10 stop:354 length:345 start_codon:yes stop_codon:yes gene_type:complete
MSGETKRVWNKMTKTMKLHALTKYADSYKLENELEDEKYDQMIIFFNDCLDKKRLQCMRDVKYDIDSDTVLSIPGFAYNSTTGMFTIRNTERHGSTIRNLPSKKKPGTVRIIDR